LESLHLRPANYNFVRENEQIKKILYVTDGGFNNEEDNIRMHKRKRMDNAEQNRKRNRRNSPDRRENNKPNARHIPEHRKRPCMFFLQGKCHKVRLLRVLFIFSNTT